MSFVKKLIKTGGRVKKIVIILFLFMVSISVFGEIFSYRYIKGEKYKIISVVDETVYIDGLYHHKARILNKISVEVLNSSEDGSSGELEANYSTSEERSGNVRVYSLAQEYYSRFNRDSTGLIDIGPDFFMPVVRNVPLFDDGDYKPGDTWSSKGYEVHDLRNGYGIKEAFGFPIDVDYKYLGKGTKDGKEYDIISIFYSV